MFPPHHHAVGWPKHRQEHVRRVCQGSSRRDDTLTGYAIFSQLGRCPEYDWPGPGYCLSYQEIHRPRSYSSTDVVWISSARSLVTEGSTKSLQRQVLHYVDRSDRLSLSTVHFHQRGGQQVPHGCDDPLFVTGKSSQEAGMAPCRSDELY